MTENLDRPQYRTQTMSRSAFMTVYDHDCPTHPDATAGTPCWTIATGLRGVRFAVCGDRVRAHLPGAGK